MAMERYQANCGFYDRCLFTSIFDDRREKFRSFQRIDFTDLLDRVDPFQNLEISLLPELFFPVF